MDEESTGTLKQLSVNFRNDHREVLSNKTFADLEQAFYDAFRIGMATGRERMYRRIDNPQEGDLVQYLAVHAIRWQPEWGQPTVAFIEAESH